MKCQGCGGLIEVRQNQTYRYAECGLDNVRLEGVEVRHCPKCGDSAVIHDMAGLHKVIAKDVALTDSPLKPREIGFLARYLACAEFDIARAVGISAEKIVSDAPSMRTMRAVIEMGVRAAVLMIVDGDRRQNDRLLDHFQREATAAEARIRQAIHVRRSGKAGKPEW